MKPVVSVVIVAYRNMDCLRACLAKLEADIRIEVIVVNNTHQNRGFGAGCNLGAAMASGDVLLFLNPDTEAEVESVWKLASYAKDNPEVGIAGPALTGDNGKVVLSVSKQPTRHNFWLVYSFLNKWFKQCDWVAKHWYHYQPPKELKKVGVVSGAAMAMRREVFDRVAGFDEKFFLYWEEVDLARRCLNQGYRVMFQPSVVMKHHGGLSTVQGQEKVLVWFRESRHYFMAKHFGPVYAAIGEGWLAVSEHWPLTLVLTGYGLLNQYGSMVLATMAYNETITVWGKRKAGLMGLFCGALAVWVPTEFWVGALFGWIVVDLIGCLRRFRKIYVWAVLMGAVCFAW